MARLDQLARIQALALARSAAALNGVATETPPGDAAIARSLLELLALRSPALRAHGERVAQYAATLAAVLGCNAALCERIRLTGLLHDLGKIGVADTVLEKTGPLSARQWSAMRKHPELGAAALEPLPTLADVALWVRHHHEFFDGSTQGYPDHLHGEQIPMPSRIVAVADALDAMTARGTGRRVCSPGEARARLAAARGRQFDPDVADAGLRLVEVLCGPRPRTKLRAISGSGR